MKAGFLPPSSSATGVKVSAAFLQMILATVALPVYKILAHFWSRSAVVSGIAPRMTLKEDGSRYLSTSSLSTTAVAGAFSEGLMMAVHPAAIAPIKGQMFSMKGKL